MRRLVADFADVRGYFWIEICLDSEITDFRRIYPQICFAEAFGVTLILDAEIFSRISLMCMDFSWCLFLSLSRLPCESLFKHVESIFKFLAHFCNLRFGIFS